ncbi:MAG: ECF transporter S component [Ruminococcaceae bacterium]|nr:ECF transporter S component [Oscillospiraceae bacterium]
MNDFKIRRMTVIAMISAIAYVLMVMVRIPVVMFLKYEPKDIIIVIGGFIYGPMAAFVASLLVSFVEFFTVSDTGVIGLIMNVLSTCSFACTAAFVYKAYKNIKGAVTGLVIGTIVMCGMMLLWNYLITPLYMNVPRQEVAKLLLPAILPFNLLKGTLNSVITFLIYKPVVKALRRAKLVATTENSSPEKRNIGVVVVALLLFVTCILAIFAFRGII